MKKVGLIASGLLLFSGCAFSNQPQVVVQKPQIQTIQPQQKVIQKPQTNKDICYINNTPTKNCTITIESSGRGVVPCQGTCSVAQAKMMARRAAIVSAYRALAEKLYGIKINGQDTVKNMMLKSSTIRSYVEGLIKGADIVDEDYKDGIYAVVLTLKLDIRKWNRLVKNCPNCNPNMQ